MGNNKHLFFSLVAGVAAILALTLTGCSKSSQSVAPGVKPSIFDVNMYPITKLVCDPFGGGTNNNVGAGISAKLYYLKDGQPRYSNTADYINNGVISTQKLFFTDINIPTRLFTEGFPTQTGKLIQNDLGQTLFEYFAIRFSTVLKLSANDTEGDYEFALLSDDGAIMSTRINGVDTEIVNNDGDHPTRMGCGTTTLHMTKNSEFLVDFTYHQGPRYHIALIPLWRKVDLQNLKETECGQLGNARYFDFNNKSKPQQPYLDIIARGWSPIPAANYNLPISAVFNPCVTGVAPIITNFTVVQIEGQYIAKWTTDILATSQIRYVDMTTAAEFLTTADNLLRTDHTVIMPSTFFLQGKNYLLQGVSISDTYGKTLSNPITIQN